MLQYHYTTVLKANFTNPLSTYSNLIINAKNSKEMNIETYYSIFDVCKPIMEANKEFKAENPQSAVKQYLKSIGENYTQIKVSGSNDVRIKAEPFYIKDGTKYRHYKKRVVWYNIV